jgi:nucleotide-binding universal stress UspA family protein
MRVLVGVNGSPDSIQALEKSVRRAAMFDENVTIAILDTPETDKSRGEIKNEVRSVIENEDITANITHLEGNPGSRLVEYAESEDFDHLIIGGGETSPMGKIQISSLAEFVLLNSHVTVTLVR